MRSYAPSPLLAPFVGDVMVSEVEGETTRLRLPEAGFVMGIRYRGSVSFLEAQGDVRLPDATLTGIAGPARRMRTSSGGAIVLVRFHAGGAARLFDAPMNELGGKTIGLDDVMKRSDVERLRMQIGEANDDASRVRVVEAFVTERVAARPPADRLVERAVDAIRERGCHVKIGELSRELGISRDALEKRFRRVVGTTPKRLASLLRLRRAIDAYRPGAPLTELALEAGYFDQSHFNRELRRMTGEAPGHFFRAARHR